MKSPLQVIIPIVLAIGALFLSSCNNESKTGDSEGTDPNIAAIPANAETVSLTVSGMT